MMGWRKLGACLLIISFLSGCITQSDYTSQNLAADKAAEEESHFWLHHG